MEFYEFDSSTRTFYFSDARQIHHCFGHPRPGVSNICESLYFGDFDAHTLEELGNLLGVGRLGRLEALALELEGLARLAEVPLEVAAVPGRRVLLLHLQQLLHRLEELQRLREFLRVLRALRVFIELVG